MDQEIFSKGFVWTTAVAYTLIYIIPFYVHPATRPSPTISRDAPHVIKTRIVLVSISTTFCTFLTYLILRQNLPPVPHTFALQSIGLLPTHLASTVLPLILTQTLFIGPLFEALLPTGTFASWISLSPLRSVFSDLRALRTYVFGPLTEELLFRAALVPLFLLSPYTPFQTVLLSPMIFGLAHVHHAYETRLTHPQAKLSMIVLSSVVQFTYTTLFGWFAAWVLVRTGSVWACVGAHAIANTFGLPRVWGRVEGAEARWEWVEHKSASTADKSEPENIKNELLKATGSDEVALAGGRDGEVTERMAARTSTAEASKNGQWVRIEEEILGSGWTVAYYILLVSGAAGFYIGFSRLTTSPDRLAVI